MHGLQRLDLRGQQLRGRELAPLSRCMRLTEVYLVRRAFGYNDHGAELPKLDIGRLAIRNAPNFLSRMVDAH